MKVILYNDIYRKIPINICNFFIDENKPQLDHIQSDFVSPQVQVLGVNNHHKGNHRLNGVLPRMNITPNPLAQEADKVSMGINHYRYSKHFAL